MFRRIAIVLLISCIPPTLFAEQTLPSGLNERQATELATLMCRQLPNVTSTRDALLIEQAKDSNVKNKSQETLLWDDVYDTLVWLGSDSVPYLVNRLTDVRWMPDPRMEPLLGTPVVGDIAYMILTDKACLTSCRAWHI